MISGDVELVIVTILVVLALQWVARLVNDWTRAWRDLVFVVREGALRDRHARGEPRGRPREGRDRSAKSKTQKKDTKAKRKKNAKTKR